MSGNWIGPGGIVIPPHLHPDVLALTAPRSPTQDAVAQRFAAEQAGTLRYCHAARAWFAWDGAIWRRDRTGLVMQRVREVARALATNAAGEVCMAAGRKIFVAGVEHLARSDPDLAVGAWPDPPLRLGTPEGPIDLATGENEPAEPARGLRRATAVAPSREAHCPVWCRFLDETCGGDAGTVAFLHRFLGYALTGSVAEQAMLFLWGPGGTGKSVFLNTLMHVMGDYAQAAPLAMLTVTPDHHTRDLAPLEGARLVAVAESERGRRWDERRLKLLTGGDPVQSAGGRSFRPSFKLIVSGNQPPRLDLVDEAVRRRLCLVPFHHRPDQPDRHLESKLRTEAAGILRWMIEGAVAWGQAGLGRCPAVEAASADYFDQQDVMGRFLAECCEGAPGDRQRATGAGELYRAWCDWAAEAGEPAGSQRAFAEALAAHGYTRHRTDRLRSYRGLTLREDMTHDAG